MPCNGFSSGYGKGKSFWHCIIQMSSCQIPALLRTFLITKQPIQSSTFSDESRFQTLHGDFIEIPTTTKAVVNQT